MPFTVFTVNRHGESVARLGTFDDLASARQQARFFESQCRSAEIDWPCWRICGPAHHLFEFAEGCPFPESKPACTQAGL